MLKMTNTKIILAMALFLVVFSIYPVYAGVGLKWDQEAKIVKQNEHTCFKYAVYNPWPKDSYAKIDISPELKSILQFQESEATFVPAETNSSKAIAIEFCFDVPSVYNENKDCWIGKQFICKQTCQVEQKVYDGDVIITESGGPVDSSGSGGSATSLSVSAPLKIKVMCVPYSRDYSLIFVIVAIIALAIIIKTLVKKYRKPKIERDKERLRKLQEEIRKESKNSK